MNLTSTPGWIFNCAVFFTVTRPVIVYGEPAADHVVFDEIVVAPIVVPAAHASVARNTTSDPTRPTTAANATSQVKDEPKRARTDPTKTAMETAFNTSQYADQPDTPPPPPTSRSPPRA